MALVSIGTVRSDIWKVGVIRTYSLHVGIALAYGSGAHPASYPKGTKDSFLGGEADQSLQSSAEVKE
jgi:hypothetical protein